MSDFDLCADGEHLFADHATGEWTCSDCGIERLAFYTKAVQDNPPNDDMLCRCTDDEPTEEEAAKVLGLWNLRQWMYAWLTHKYNPNGEQDWLSQAVMMLHHRFNADLDFMSDMWFGVSSSRYGKYLGDGEWGPRQDGLFVQCDKLEDGIAWVLWQWVQKYPEGVKDADAADEENEDD